MYRVYQYGLGDQSFNSKFTKSRIASLGKNVSREDATIDHLGLTI